METYGFHFRFRLCGQPPTIEEFTFDDTEELHAGDLISVTSGGADLGVYNDTTLVGAAVEYVSGTADVSKIKVITDRDAVYAVHDANARTIGTEFDLTGATGAQTLTTDSSHTLKVVKNSTATEPTLVMINAGMHAID
jgi:hypothetical protein